MDFRAKQKIDRLTRKLDDSNEQGIVASVRMEEGAMEVHTRSDHLKDALGFGSGRQDSRKRELHKQGSRGKREDNTEKNEENNVDFLGSG